MMQTEEYKLLLQQRHEIDAKLKSARKEFVETTLKNIKLLIDDASLTYEELVSILPKPKKKQQKTYAPKYRNPTTGETWAGRGKKPTWLDENNIEKYKI